MSKTLLCVALILACAGSAVAYNKSKLRGSVTVGAGVFLFILAVRSKS
jgi:carbonic anhydrase/acetyltransferase-like protein (isoleucine patch superfamily)